jgi:ABC-2 type transport system permease protein
LRKFLAVVKHEYRKIVMRWSFILGTLLMPAMAVIFAFVPMLIFSIRSEPARIAVYDPDGAITERLEAALTRQDAGPAKIERMDNTDTISPLEPKQPSVGQSAEFKLLRITTSSSEPEAVRRELLDRIRNKEFDSYLIIPRDATSPEAEFEYRSRRGGDFVLSSTIRKALDEAVRSQRLSDAKIDETELRRLTAPIKFDAKGLDETGTEKDSGGVFVASFVIALMIYLTLTIYGQAILGAVVEEKETRIAEILFSSARPITLMFGKLVGVGLAGLTQLSIWVISAVSVITFAALQADLRPFLKSVPSITPGMVFLFLLFFLLGYFIYASIYALIGSAVTSVQEGGQFSFPAVVLMLISFYFSFAVMRDPNSSVSFWVSIAPFFAPITMPVRILAEMPPLWQIGLSLALNILAIVGLMWVAARVYRVGMLIYGKRATIPEIWKWMRYS